MAKSIKSLFMENLIWDRIDEQAKIMRSNRSEICERMFADAFGMIQFLPKPTTPPKMKVTK